MAPDNLHAIWNAAISSPEALAGLRSRLPLAGCQRDIYLAYSIPTGCQFAGYLVTVKDDIDHLIAFCPVSMDFHVATTAWLRVVTQQLENAIHVADRLFKTKRRADVIWLNSPEEGRGEIPPWIFSLACAPLTREWSGSYEYPRPFCPRLFESMAQQPEAAGWMRERLSKATANAT